MHKPSAMLIAASGAATLSSLAQDPVFVASDPQGTLVYRVEYPLPVTLEQSAFEEFDGWISFGVGFEPLSEDEPQNDMFALPLSADIELVLVAADDNMHIYAPDRSRHLEIGEAYYLGHPYFHHHPVWNLTEGTVGENLTMTFFFRDRSGMYEDSGPLVMTFVTVPSTAGLSLFAGAASAMARRRRAVA